LISLVTIWDLIRMFQALDQVVEKVLMSTTLVASLSDSAL